MKRFRDVLETLEESVAKRARVEAAHIDLFAQLDHVQELISRLFTEEQTDPPATIAAYREADPQLSLPPGILQVNMLWYAACRHVFGRPWGRYRATTALANFCRLYGTDARYPIASAAPVLSPVFTAAAAAWKELVRDGLEPRQQRVLYAHVLATPTHSMHAVLKRAHDARLMWAHIYTACAADLTLAVGRLYAKIGRSGNEIRVLVDENVPFTGMETMDAVVQRAVRNGVVLPGLRSGLAGLCDTNRSFEGGAHLSSVVYVMEWYRIEHFSLDLVAPWFTDGSQTTARIPLAPTAALRLVMGTTSMGRLHIGETNGRDPFVLQRDGADTPYGIAHLVYDREKYPMDERLFLYVRGVMEDKRFVVSAIALSPTTLKVAYIDPWALAEAVAWPDPPRRRVDFLSAPRGGSPRTTFLKVLSSILDPTRYDRYPPELQARYLWMDRADASAEEARAAQIDAWIMTDEPLVFMPRPRDQNVRALKERPPSLSS